MNINLPTTEVYVIPHIPSTSRERSFIYQQQGKIQFCLFFFVNAKSKHFSQKVTVIIGLIIFSQQQRDKMVKVNFY